MVVRMQSEKAKRRDEIGAVHFVFLGVVGAIVVLILACLHYAQRVDELGRDQERAAARVEVLEARVRALESLVFHAAPGSSK